MRKGKYEKTKEPVINFAMSLAVVLFWLVIITTYLSAGLFAKYSTSGTGGDSARVITFGDLTVTENEVAGFTGKEYIFIPGVNLQKKVTVDFEGSEADTFVFVAVDATGWTVTGTHQFSLTRGTKPIMSWAVDSKWTYLASNGSQHVYYVALDSGETLDEQDFIANGGTITVNVAANADYEALEAVDLKLHVTAYAVQANGFYVSNNMADNAAAAWNSVSK